MTLPSRMLIALICLAILVMPVGAHVHLCFDGQEPPASLHLLDGSVEHGHAGVGTPHHDANVGIGAQAIPKAAKSVPTATAVVLIAWLFLIPLPIARVRRFLPVRQPPKRPPRFLRPLLRGPPR